MPAVVVALAFVLALAAGRVSAADYVSGLKPLFRERCYSCHGALQQKGGLRLDTVELMRRGGKSGPALVPGDPDGSELVRRVSTADLDDRMPPEHEGQPFSGEQLGWLREWIRGGAPGPGGETPEADPREHWAFLPVKRPAVPELDPVRRAWVRNPIDAFVAEAHAREGLRPQLEAPRGLLVRRLYVDLVGVPPSGDELDRAMLDAGEGWYERLVDRLLEDPRHGERWARHWMDIWRYSDAWGLGEQHRNSQKHIWHWRDWLVESLNADLAYDEMLRLMLAADETYPTDVGRLRATGFLARNYFLFNRNQWLDETVEHVGKGLLGLTLNCSKCHDHKYDPIPQVEYYRMRAVFEPYHARLDVVPGEPDLGRDGLPRVFDREPETPTYRFVRGQETQPDKTVAIPPGVPSVVGLGPLEIRPVELPVEAWQPERRPWVFSAYRDAALGKVRRAEEVLARARQAAAPEPRDAAGGREVREAEVARAGAGLRLAEAELESVRARAAAMESEWSGASDREAKRQAAVRSVRVREVARAGLAVAELELRLLQAAADKKDAVAKELGAARENRKKLEGGLEAGIKADETFERLVGAAWVATRFLDSTKDDPAREFPKTSTGRRTALASWITDPRNPLTARVVANHLWNRHFGAPLVATVFDFGRKGTPPTHPALLDWLASEMVSGGWSLKRLHRLIVTSATYRMGSGMAGALEESRRDPDNRWLWRRQPVRLEAQVVRDAILHQAGRLEGVLGGVSVPPGEQGVSRRRSLYFYHSNNDRNLFLSTFDDALVKECYRREQSVVPQQALALLNAAMVHENAAAIAGRLGRRAGIPDEAFVVEAFRVLLGTEPRAEELEASARALAAWRGDGGRPGDAAAARANLVWALLNHGDFVTVR